jgi:hypothetical protein
VFKGWRAIFQVQTARYSGGEDDVARDRFTCQVVHESRQQLTESRATAAQNANFSCMSHGTPTAIDCGATFHVGEHRRRVVEFGSQRPRRRSGTRCRFGR